MEFLNKDSDQQDHEEIWEEALPARHLGAVTSMSAAVTRELLVTASSEDLTVRVWSYQPLRSVLTHYCHHTPLAVGMGPW